MLKVSACKPDSYLSVNTDVDSQLFVQVLLSGLAGFGLTLSSQHLALCSVLEAEAGCLLVDRLSHVLLQRLDEI